MRINIRIKDKEESPKAGSARLRESELTCSPVLFVSDPILATEAQWRLRLKEKVSQKHGDVNV